MSIRKKSIPKKSKEKGRHKVHSTTKRGKENFEEDVIERREEFEFFKENMEKFSPQKWEQAFNHKLHMDVFNPRHNVPDDENVLRIMKNEEVGIFIGDKDEYMGTIEQSDNPDKYGSFGYIDCFAKISSESQFIPGTLVLRFDKEKVKRNMIVEPTVRLFRWDEELKSYVKIHTSGLIADKDSNCVWGRIFVPGIYAVIGQNSNPLVRRTIRILFLLRNLFRVLSKSQSKQLQNKLATTLFSRQLNNWMKALNSSQIETLNQGDLIDSFLPFFSENHQSHTGYVLDETQLEHLGKQFLGMDLSKGTLPDYTFENECMDLGWQSEGPENVTGCFVQVLIDPSNNDRLYAAASNGGLWRLDSVAQYPTPTWIPLTDQNETLQIKSVAVAALDSNIIYIADGLGYILRSDNQGLHWRRTSNQYLGSISKILVDPNDSNRVYVASNSALWSSSDGISWNISNAGHIFDMAMDPHNSSILYIGKYNVGLLKSYDAGQSWQLMLPWSTADQPVGPMIKIALGYLGNDSERMVAVKFDQEIFINRNGGRPSGTTGGGPWESKGKYGGDGYGTWCHAISIDPFDNNVILAGAQMLFRSSDGGNSWLKVMDFYSPHEDQHSIAFDPTQQNVVYVSNDGGVFRSTDGGINWTQGNSDHPTGDDIRYKRNLNRGLVAAQFYHVGISAPGPGSWSALGNVFHSGSFGTTHLRHKMWEGVGGHSWEWVDIHSDPKRRGIFYLFNVGANMLARERYPKSGNPNDFIGDFGKFKPTAIAVDRRSSILLAGTDNPGRIMRTLNGDVDNPVWAAESGINIDNEPIVSIVFMNGYQNHRSSGMAYAVSRSGRVFQKPEIRDATDWQEKGQWVITGVKELAINPYDTNRLYLITENQIARSQDGGVTWIPIMGTGNNRLPVSFIKSIAVYPYHGQTLFVALETGIFITNDEGQNWHPFDTGLPNAEVKQIFWQIFPIFRMPDVRNDYLYAATHGRGLWRRSVCL